MIQTQPEALSLYPHESWADVQDKLREISQRQPRMRNKVLGVTANATEVVPDKQGRILIPEKMRKSISIDTEAMVVGALNHIEIWDPKKFDAVTSQADNDFDQHIEGVFA